MNLVLRVDVSTQIGTGHLMRCLAIAQAWQDAGGEAIFVMTTEAPNIKARLESESMKVVKLLVESGSIQDATETVSIAYKLDAIWIVVDGYQFRSKYQKIIKNAGLHLLFIDDYGHTDHYYADIILNQNIDAHKSLYANRQPYTQLLLGTRYALLRREFWHWREWQRALPCVASKILVTLGGSDPDNVTLRVIKALQLVKVREIEVLIVTGGSNPHYEQIQLVCQDMCFPMCLKTNVTNMPELMAWADIAIAGGGSTSWELAFMGLPSIILILADNQRTIAKSLGEQGVSINLGWHDDVSSDEIADAVSLLLELSETRVEMVSREQVLVDGLGVNRVLRIVKSLS